MKSVKKVLTKRLPRYNLRSRRLYATTSTPKSKTAVHKPIYPPKKQRRYFRFFHFTQVQIPLTRYFISALSVNSVQHSLRPHKVIILIGSHSTLVWITVILQLYRPVFNPKRSVFTHHQGHPTLASLISCLFRRELRFKPVSHTFP